ncbi:hypothetical protein CY35_17G089900 [Sphagnum magellanicum]|nr:hypothetical protein CY35_17G089900 [Sphagnum magellanicum]
MQKNPSMATPLSFALHLCERIREEYSQEHLCPLAINRQLCMLLSNKVLETENTLKPIQVKLSQLDTTSSGFPNVGPATEELVHVLRAAHTTIFKDCFCNGRWMESALRQGGDLKETFAEILYDLQWYMMVLRSIFLEWTFQDSWTPPSWLLQQVDCDRNLTEHDNDSLFRAAKQDQEDLKGLLWDLKGDHACHGERCTGLDINVQCLASQLRKKMEFEEQFQAWPTQDKKDYHEELYKVNGIKLTKWPFVVLANRQDLHKRHLLGSGSFGSVHEANWLGESYAMKIPKHPSTELLKQEIAAVAGQRADERCHPKKADVYSFGLICCAVLIGEPTPFPVDELLKPTVFKDRVREGKRPQLPHYCPNQLSNLIQQCWDGNPDERPNFQEICTKLRHIKGLLLTEGSSPEGRNLLASRVSTSSSIQERAYRAYSSEDTSETLARAFITLLEGVPGIRKTLRGQEDPLRSRPSPADMSRVSSTERSKASRASLAERSPAERSRASPVERSPVERSRASPAKRSRVSPVERSRASLAERSRVFRVERLRASPTEKFPVERSRASAMERLRVSSLERSRSSSTERLRAERSRASPMERLRAERSRASPTERLRVERSRASPMERLGAERSRASPTERSPVERSKVSPTERSRVSPTERSPAERSRASPTEMSSAERSRASLAERLRASSLERLRASPTEKLRAERSRASSLERLKASSLERSTVGRSRVFPAERSRVSPMERSKASSLERSTVGRLRVSSAERSRAFPTERSRASPMERSTVERSKVSPVERSRASSAEKWKAFSLERLKASSLERSTVERSKVSPVERSRVSRAGRSPTERSRAFSTERSKTSPMERSSPSLTERSPAEWSKVFPTKRSPTKRSMASPLERSWASSAEISRR